MRTTDTIVIGGGQAGLAMSRCLADRGIEHVVLERGRVGERWRSERWDSLSLLTPRWQSRLPGFRYDGPDPDGYMTSAELVTYLERYARSFAAPVQDETTVRSVAPTDGGYRVATDAGSFRARSVVIATGYCDRPYVPRCARRLSPRVRQVVPTRYRRPADLPAGGVLIVGASATGVQLAEELSRSGRSVWLAVGKHTRLPRTYRGRDILWWLDRMGVFDETAEAVPDIHASRAQPSLQLVGRADRGDLDLARLQRMGVRLLGRLVDVDGETVRFDGDLPVRVGDADRKLRGLLDRVDAFARRSGGAPGLDGPWRPVPVRVDTGPDRLNLRDVGIESVLWATGFRRSYPWLEVPVLDGAGDIRHRGGVTPAPGLYVLGMRFQRRRKSSFIDGVGDDAGDVAAHLAGRLAKKNAA